MDFRIKIEGLDRVTKKLNDLAKRQVPFAVKNTINDLLPMIKDAEVTEMKQVFDRPTPVTLRGIYLKAATKQKMEGIVGLKDKFWTGLAVNRYLYPEIFGGERFLKNSERLLQRANILPKGMYLAPGPGARLDRYGNMTGNQMVQILSALGAAETSGYMMNRTLRSKKLRGKKLKQFFAITKTGLYLRPGIWERTTKGPRLILMFVRRPIYKARFFFYQIGQKVVNEKFSQIFEKRMNEALRTAR